jgi:hypothetical protein
LEDVLASKKKQQNLYSSTTNKLAQYEEKQRQHEKDLKKRGNDNRLASIFQRNFLLQCLESSI